METILKYCLPMDLSQYSLTGKSLQERMEVRNGQTQSRVVMAESGSSKLCIPPQLIGKNIINYNCLLVPLYCSKSTLFFEMLTFLLSSAGIAHFLKLYLTADGLAASGGSSLSSYTRKLISKSRSRSQEKRNLETKATRLRK